MIFASAAGAPWRSILLKVYWPQVQPAFWGIALFRWDIGVRESSVLGLWERAASA